jgi:hypothetical protein
VISGCSDRGSAPVVAEMAIGAGRRLDLIADLPPGNLIEINAGDLLRMG